MAEPAVAMGGLSVTGCLADFSVNMFHPYGGKKSSLKEAQWSPLSDTERKDSLSINVEFVKFHLSRSRKLDFQTDQDQSKATVRFSSKCSYILFCVNLTCDVYFFVDLVRFRYNNITKKKQIEVHEHRAVIISM